MQPMPSLDRNEIEKFARLAGDWWNPDGPFAPLHKFNPVRLQFIRDAAAAHFGRDPRSIRPFAGLSLLDLGCGGGLIAEPMARLGFDVTGCDAGEETVRAAEAHAADRGLPLVYRCASAEELAAEAASFDVVLALEVAEHVADVESFLAAVARLVRPGGLLIVATINKTLKSLALAKIAAEYILRWLPAGTHDWNRFRPPARLCGMIESAGLRVLQRQGFSFDPLSWTWRLTNDLDVNYAVAASKSVVP
ncbi:MAG: bifunctional 2-polyprenyl-6-hydroxyphenol methylase/3-demethylubiquinol 3-O-methyltransferase UbiG [Alphaproteobacteria bacterium]|nr:bifunctional 2-polyprenyl-6-hydroxyphenol methylase/3-demethylubiquinol 3-O-methyltransferase UbiG [Alphaproteobacteria bacterium]